MKRWCKTCQGSFPEREGGIVYAEDNTSLYWICHGCTRNAKVSGDRRVRAIEDILDEGGGFAVEAVLDGLRRTPKT